MTFERRGRSAGIRWACGLSIAFTEVWERFAFYGMQALLVLYRVGRLFKPGLGSAVRGGWARGLRVLARWSAPYSLLLESTSRAGEHRAADPRATAPP